MKLCEKQEIKPHKSGVKADRSSLSVIDINH